MKYLNKLFIKKEDSKLDKIDFLILGVILVVYGIFSFINLGSMRNPQTFIIDEDSKKEYILKVSGDTSNVTKMRYFVGPKSGSYMIYGSSDGTNYEFLGLTSEDDYVFGWYDVSLNSINDMKYLRLVSSSTEASLGEIYLDKNVKLTSSNKESKVLIDEQKTVPEEISYMNSTYFDEVYFARAAYEYANGMPVYEWVHPPLGKLIQAIPVALFGMTPFAYRFMGNISGILLIAIMYAFAKALFKNRGYAIIASLFMVFDNFHFAQTRIGTTDSHLVLFILSSYYFMYRYLELPKESNIRSKLLFLGLSGITIACAISTKWTGLFAGLGLAIIFFLHFYKTYFYKKDKITKEDKKEMWKIISSCVFFFVVIPITLYIECYFLFPNVSVYRVTDLKSLFNITDGIYYYHSTLDATHPFSSDWYTWPLMLKPVWYYSGSVIDGMRGTISGIGNIAIWWTGIVGIIYCFFRLLKKEKSMIIILIAFSCLYFPYLKIGRCMFLYHYFTVLPFVMLALTKLLKDLVDKTKKYIIIPIFLVIVIACFIYFFPIVSGMPLKETIIESMRWLPDWYF